MLRELLSYKSAILGLGLLLFLLSISVYAIVAIPYSESINLWRGEGGIWLENPRNAQPYWVRYLGMNLPENIELDSSQAGSAKILTPIPGSNLKMLNMAFSFDYDYDDFPSEINIFFTSKYTGSAPVVRINWIKPGNKEIKLPDYILGSQSDKFYLSIDPKVSSLLYDYTAKITSVKPESALPVEQVLFAVENKTMANPSTIRPLKGTYTVVIEGTLFGADSVLDAKIVIYGKVYGLAGTDHLRRDLTIALLWGTPIALSFGLVASIAITSLQILLASVSGYYGGKIDSAIQRLTEVYMILPFLPFLILAASLYKVDIWVILLMIIVLSIFGQGVKSTRALVMQIKEYPYVEAARSYGASPRRIILYYIIPKILPTVIPSLIAAVPGYVFLEASLAFLGLGDPYLPSWGKVIDDSFTGGALYKGYYYWVLEPAFMLILTAFAFSFLGFALDKLVNPRLKEV